MPDTDGIAGRGQAWLFVVGNVITDFAAHGFNAVNVLQGYPSVRIVAPTFLIHGHEEKEIL